MTKWNEVTEDTIAFELDTELKMAKQDLPKDPEPITSILLQSLTELQ